MPSTDVPLPPPLLRLARQQDGAVTWQQLGGHVPEAVVRRLVRAGVLVRARRGVYVVRPLARRDTLRLRSRTAVLATGGVVGGRTAGALWGLAGVDDGPVEVVVEPSRTVLASADLRPRRRLLAPDEVTDLQGLPVTTPARSVADVVLEADRLTGIAVLDSALRTGRLRRTDLERLRAAVAGRAGAARTSSLWGWADGRAESVLESRVRLRLLDAGLPPDDLQVRLRDADGRVVARVDMVYRRRTRGRRGLLVVEADGAGPHGALDALYRDRRRSNELVARHDDVIRVTWRDTCDPCTVPDMVRAAL